MGNVLDTFAEINQADGPVEPKPLQHKRLLALDPRSPSACIDRTPIIVERTPAGEKPAHVSLQEDTPRTSRVSPPDVVLDPRSPTNDFTRTPINPCIATAVARRISPAMIASGGLHQSPSLSHESESGIESADVTPVLKRRKAKDEATEQAESPDSALSFDSLDHFHCKLMEQHFPEPNVLNSEESVSPNLNTEPQPEEKNSAASFAVRVKNNENLIKDHVIRFPSQINRKTEALTLTPGVVRSPLSLVENSRRTMSHRNNIMSGGGKQLMKYSGIVDKENVFH